MIHKEIEVYVDDVIIKSKKNTDHMEDLRKLFNRLQRYNLKLNPAKCAFGVPARKLLGFIMSLRGIELDPSKVKAIQELPPPNNKKDKAIKGHALADHIDENLVDGEYEPIKTYFRDEEVSFIGEDIVESYEGWRMFFDGAANFKGVGIGAILVSETSQHYPVSTKFRFPCTNNMAEYEACILGLKMAVDMNIQELLEIGDSDLLIHQVQEEWVTKNSKIFPYLHHVQELRKRHKNSTAYKPQMNGAVEVANKNIKKLLMKMIEKHKQWHKNLSFALLGHRTIVRTSTGATPYMLVYGTEVVILTEVEIPSLRIIQKAELDDVEWVKSRYEHLALIERKRVDAVCHDIWIAKASDMLHIHEIDSVQEYNSQNCSCLPAFAIHACR
ncbi:uncharacterized protein [Nicotiana sylvestris]|uniref:uncharacterized protein n=1 Tax=Nicotiana sylvestris TaxID=4096 RepID=UPI00388CA83F